MNAVDAVQQQARRPLPFFDQIDAGDDNAGFGTTHRVVQADGWHAFLTDSRARPRKSVSG